MNAVEIVRVAERALLVRFHDAELGVAVAKAQALFFEAKGEMLSEKENDERPSLKGKTVLGAGSLLMELPAGATEAEMEHLRAQLTALATELASSPATEVSAPSMSAPEHRLETHFGGEEGPDLAAVARGLGIGEQRVVELLCGADLRVAFIGFSPGFPYLIGLPRELEVPRLASPRPRVPKGSVAIAGPFAGVYPNATPGGWHLLGRLADGEPALFDPRRDPPARFAPGDRVRFVPRAPGA